MNASIRMFDVAIVGFGPAGAVAAGLLGQKGVSVYVCDQLLDVYDKPRAIALDHEITRLFQQMGVASRIKPYLEPFTDSVYLGVDGHAIQRMSTVAKPYPLGHTPSVVFTQPPVERILRQHAESFDSVTVALGQALVGFEQHADHVTLNLLDLEGKKQTVRARYVIGCDGASSTVRGQAGIELNDLGFDEPWLVVDVKVNEKGLLKLPQTSIQYCNPTRPATFVIGVGNHRRWEIAINPGEDPHDLATPDGAWRLLAPWLTPDDGELWRQASYRFHALVADRWRVGRVMVAGDAAHQQPPFLGQGMCQGLRDVANLTWKLEAVLKGRAPESLLDTYGEERKAHVTALTSRIKDIGKIVTERDVNKARERDAKLLDLCNGNVKPMPRQDMQPPLSAGLLASPVRPAHGTIFPQPWLVRMDGSRVRMDDLLGHGWRLIARDARYLPKYYPLQQIYGMNVTAACLGEEGFCEEEGVVEAWFERYAANAVLVRPDNYVYGVAQSASDLEELLNHISLNTQAETASF